MRRGPGKAGEEKEKGVQDGRRRGKTRLMDRNDVAGGSDDELSVGS
jgi:hypothetical protein